MITKGELHKNRDQGVQKIPTHPPFFVELYEWEEIHKTDGRFFPKQATSRIIAVIVHLIIQYHLGGEVVYSIVT